MVFAGAFFAALAGCGAGSLLVLRGTGTTLSAVMSTAWRRAQPSPLQSAGRQGRPLTGPLVGRLHVGQVRTDPGTI
ncbi:MAG: hypothetical protein LC777_20605, partial [Actinobacteria bacterium]|nr:hypothetical protein [Actinomycetota bacterium]